MNINKYGINGLLKTALIISIFFSISNYVSADNLKQSPASRLEQETQPPASLNSNENNTNNNNSNSNNLQQNESNGTTDNNELETQPNNTINQVENETSIPEQTQRDIKDINLANSQKNLSIKDILLFIDLPILSILLLLWFLNKNKQQKQIDKLTKNQNKIIGNFNQFNEINNKLNNLDRINRQIIEKIQDNNQKIIDSEVRLRELLSNQQVDHSISDRNSLDFNSNTNFYSLNSIAIVDKVLQFVETYNQDKNFISDKAKFMVAETQASLNQRRSGNSDVITLENTTQKKYCIIEEDNNNYLVPHAKIKFDDFNKSTLESLFDCSNFTAEYSDFKLVKPAKVSQLPSETWQLETKGKLEFS